MSIFEYLCQIKTLFMFEDTQNDCVNRKLPMIVCKKRWDVKNR